MLKDFVKGYAILPVYFSRVPGCACLPEVVPLHSALTTDPALNIRDGSKSFFASPSQVTSHFLASPSQVTSHFRASPSQVTSQLVRRQVQVKSQVIWSKHKSSHN